MSAPYNNTRYQVAPPFYHYFTFSIDVAATLELYCDGGDATMLQKLDGVQDLQYAGYTFFDYTSQDSEEMPKFQTFGIQPLQQGLTKPHPRKPQYTRPHMCAPVLPTTAHPSSRAPLDLSRGPLPWDNCYHPTCYNILARVPSEWKDYLDSPCATFSLSFCKAHTEDERYVDLLRAELDDDRILRILDGREDAPDRDNTSETDSQICKTFLAKIPGIDKPEEDCSIVPVLRIDHVLLNVPEISDPSQLHGDVDLFQGIVQDYQLARYESVLLYPPAKPEIDDASSDTFSMNYSGASMESFSSLPEAPGSSPDLHELVLTSEVSPQVAVPIRKRKWKLKSLFKRAVANFVELVKWPRKLSNKL
ncbi:hypothetical protein F5146DRAFT_1229140 [Armillaria mellea]|nr:hypothetical protein F5146DRAFT_1229140 [Armillaria mellea]